MNCREVLQLVYVYLDNELTDEVISKVKNHLKICEHCFDTYEFEKQLHTLVTKKGQVNVNTERLKSKVLREIDKLENGGSSPSLFSKIRPFIATSAAIVVITVGLMFLLGRNNSTIFAGSFIESHRDCLNRVSSGEHRTMTLTEIDSCFSEVMNVPDVFLQPSANRQATSGSVRTCEDVTAAQIMFHYGNSEISVFVIENKDFVLSEELTVVDAGHHKYWYESADGVTVLFWNCMGFWCAAVSELDVDSMITFAMPY